nr:putative ribonuclease H-like domain-containing protein [Tanacetum cinerariifolium]
PSTSNTSKAARTMLADPLLPILFWVEVVNTACYVQNKVLVSKPHNKTPYELLHGRTPREESDQQYVLFLVWSSGSINPHNTDGDTAFNGKEPELDEKKLESEVNVSLRYRNLSVEFEDFSDNSINEVNAIEEPKRVNQALKDPSCVKAMQEELLQFMMQKVWILVDLPYGKRAIGFEDPDLPDKEEVNIFQPPGFEDPDLPDKVYKVVKAVYGLHQDPRAWYETLAKYLLENGFQISKIDQTLFIKRQKDRKSASTSIDTEKPLPKDPDGEDVDVHTYRSMIGSLMYLTSLRPDIMFAIDLLAMQEANSCGHFIHRG